MASVPIILDPRGFFVGATAQPELILVTGTNAPVTSYAFDATTREDLYIDLSLLSYGASAGNITLKVRWYSRTGQTSGDVIWGARIAAITPGDAVSMEAKSWATAQVSSATTVNSTAKGLTESTITISNLDSAAANDEVWLNLYRDAADGGDTMTGDACFTSGYMTYSDA